LIDLPGLYSLDATSLDEQIARDVLTGKVKNLPIPDAIVAVVDATNLERNLYLVAQLLEYKIPLVVALTMIDEFERREHEIDIERFSKLLGVPVFAITAASNRGIEELTEKVAEIIEKKPEIKFELKTESDQSENAKIFARYNFISNAVQESVKHKDLEAHNFSERIDRVLTHKIFGLFILVAILLLVFQTIFSWANVPMDLLEKGFGAIGDLVKANLPEGLLTDLIVDGIIAGVGGVLVFLPQILLLFFFISILEDTGYMARAAFLMDKLMSKVGLHGKAFLPLMSSFACAIPGIMATRTIENPKDRLATILIAPFMSCSARLPVYALMIATFFAGQTVLGFISLGAVLMLGMYALGIVTAIIAAFILKKTLLKSPPPPFVMELPPYRLPNLRSVLQNMFQQGWMFVRRAGTIILAISIILWALTTFPRTAPEVQTQEETASEQLKNSYSGQIGHLIEPVIKPLGFDWKIGIALISSFAAREVVGSTLSIIYRAEKSDDEDESRLFLSKAIKEEKNDDGTPVWTPLTAITLMVFFVLAIQCMSTVAIVRRETNSWAWTLFMVGYMTGLAYLAALLTYQGGKLLGVG
jgi:ferrous iron transport protein B